MFEYIISKAYAEDPATPPAIVNIDKEPAGLIKGWEGVFTALNNITNWIFGFFLVVAVLFILVGAYELLISKGDPEGFAKAKKTLLYAVIAIAIAVMAKSIVIVVAKIVGTTIVLP
jgi:hypothetical protein